MHPILCDGEWTVVDPEKTEIHEKLEPLLMVLEGKPCCRYVGLTTDGKVGVAMPNSHIRFPTTYTIKAFKAKAEVAGRILATVRWLAPDGIQPLPQARAPQEPEVKPRRYASGARPRGRCVAPAEQAQVPRDEQGIGVLSQT